MPRIFIDADACPVKDEVYRVAKRYSLDVTVVSNSKMRTPNEPWIRVVVVKDDKLDAADDWIAEQASENDIVISSDIPLASRCLKKGALVLGCTGREFTHDSIGGALATRELLQGLRESGANVGGPAPFGKKDRSRFLQKLDELVVRIKRTRR
ncbi:MAG: YaiI/YqxD family protein [Chitinispirillaceae bacterium]